MSTAIGHQDGIVAEYNRLRDLDPAGTKLKKKDGKWPSLDTLTTPVDQWGAWDKAERRARILKDDHDAALANPAPPPTGGGGEPPPAQTYVQVAPRVAYKAGGSDARFCIHNQPGVTVHGDGSATDAVASYDPNGLCRGGRSDGPAVTSALEIDGREYCSLPTMGDPKLNTGSWAI